MKLTDWHNRIVSQIPHAEIVTPPGERVGHRRLDDKPSDDEATHHYSTVDLWLGYGRYRVEAVATGIQGDVERVHCNVVPRDTRKNELHYRARVYESTAGTEDTLQRMLFAILAYEAEQHV